MSRELIVKLRENLHKPLADGLPVILRDLRRAAELARDPSQNLAERERTAHSLATLIFAFLEEETDKAFGPEALRLLFTLGRPGIVLGLKHLRRRRLPAPEAEALILSGPKPEQLLFFNHYFQAPADLDPVLDARFWKAFLALASEDAELILNFLGQGLRLALPIQKALVEGSFWMWMRRLFKGGLAPDQAAYVANSLAALESAEVAVHLAGLLDTSSAQAVRALLTAMGAAGATRDPRIIKPLAGLLDHADLAVRQAALGLLVGMKAPRAALAWAKCSRQGKEGRPALALIALKMDSEEFRALLSALPVEDRKELILTLFSALSLFFPGFLHRFLGSAASGAKAAAAVDALMAFSRDHKPPKLLGKLFRPPVGAEAAPWFEPVAGTALPEKKKGGLFCRKPAEGPSLAEQMAGDGATGVEAPGQVLADKSFKGLSLRGAGLNRCCLTKVVFEDCVFTQVDLRGARLDGVRFTNCRFQHVRLGEATLVGSTFESCRFERCDLVRATFERARLTECEWSGCMLDQAAFSASALDRCLFEACNFWAASFRGVEASGVSFESTDFSQAFFSACRFQGLGLAECTFTGARGREMLLAGVSVQGCSFEGAHFLGLTTFDPDFLEAEARTLDHILAASAERFEPQAAPPACSEGPALSLAARAVAEWIAQREARDRCRLSMAHNRRRLAWAGAKMGAEAGRFLRLLPLVLAADLSATAKGAFAHTPCLVDGGPPTHGERRLLERYFPGAKLTPFEPGGVRVLGLYSIGSFGSIAQTGASDIDLWVCLTPDSPRGEDLFPFRAKMAWLETWAASTFGLEVHFFPMELSKAQTNDFGLSDEEGAGSSLALLLKEEFYRTSLCLAGRVPVWLLTDPGAPEAAYAAQVLRLERLAGFPAEGLLDLGHLGQIPEDEFFGASLWQIVKALKSPFKSVMKLALMEKCMERREEAGTLLCDRLKANLHRGVRDLWAVDPYALLFKEVNDHYQARGDQETMLLLGMAFCLKAGVGGRDDLFPRLNPQVGNSLGEYFYPSSTFRPGDKIKTAQADIQTFTGRSEVGQKVAQFMAGAYQRMTKGLGQDVAARISRQDLTKLGRRVMAHFSPKENKVMRIPFMSSPKGLFRTLSFSAEAGQWVAKGQLKAIGEHKGDHKPDHKMEAEVIRREPGPLKLMAWLIVNGIYTPDVYLQIDPALSPVSAEDAAALMKALYDFFPWKQTFDPDMEQNLAPEQVVKAFFALNLRAPRQETAVTEAGLVLATNWGEMFCIPEAKNPARAERAPFPFLKENTKAKMAEGILCTAFVPKHANCPPIHFF